MRDYHCCATCVNFKIIREDNIKYVCDRLGYETSPKYKFNCWEPKENVQKLLEREKKNLAE